MQHSFTASRFYTVTANFSYHNYIPIQCVYVPCNLEIAVCKLEITNRFWNGNPILKYVQHKFEMFCTVCKFKQFWNCTAQITNCKPISKLRSQFCTFLKLRCSRKTTPINMTIARSCRNFHRGLIFGGKQHSHTLCAIWSRELVFLRWNFSWQFKFSW